MLDINNLKVDKLAKVGSPAIKVREVVRVRLMDKEELKRQVENGGSKLDNVKVTYADGSVSIVDRATISRNFSSINGAPIKMKYLSSKRSYIMVAPAKEECLIARVPRKIKVVKGGKRIPAGSCIVIYGDNERVEVISKGAMQKMFLVKGKPLGGRGKGSLRNGRPVNTVKIEQEPVKRVETREVRQVVEKQTKEPKGISQAVLVASIVTSGGQLVGYVVRDTKGREHQVNKANTLTMARKGMLTNAVAVENERGKRFLRGKGMEIGNLPKVIK